MDGGVGAFPFPDPYQGCTARTLERFGHCTNALLLVCALRLGGGDGLFPKLSKVTRVDVMVALGCLLQEHNTLHVSGSGR